MLWEQQLETSLRSHPDPAPALSSLPCSSALPFPASTLSLSFLPTGAPTVSGCLEGGGAPELLLPYFSQASQGDRLSSRGMWEAPDREEKRTLPLPLSLVEPDSPHHLAEAGQEQL